MHLSLVFLTYLSYYINMYYAYTVFIPVCQGADRCSPVASHEYAAAMPGMCSANKMLSGETQFHPDSVFL